jgi:hypothetical protein
MQWNVRKKFTWREISDRNRTGKPGEADEEDTGSSSQQQQCGFPGFISMRSPLNCCESNQSQLVSTGGIPLSCPLRRTRRFPQAGPGPGPRTQPISFSHVTPPVRALCCGVVCLAAENSSVSPALVLGVPAAVFAPFQISDRFGSDSQSSSPTSTSAHSRPRLIHRLALSSRPRRPSKRRRPFQSSIAYCFRRGRTTRPGSHLHCRPPPPVPVWMEHLPGGVTARMMCLATAT